MGGYQKEMKNKFVTVCMDELLSIDILDFCGLTNVALGLKYHESIYNISRKGKGYIVFNQNHEKAGAIDCKHNSSSTNSMVLVLFKS